MKPAILLVLSVFLVQTGGCVFWDIRDEVRKSNERIDAVETKLAETNAGLEGTNARLDGVTEKLRGVDHSLQRLDETNRSLSDVQTRLALLKALQTSLASIDVHLASLRKTVGRIDGMIPFLDLGTSEDGAPTAAAVAVETPADGAAAPPAAPAEGGPAKSAGGERGRDALVGVWVTQYPDRSTALVLIEGGRYLRHRAATAGAPATIESGTWKRDGKSVTLVSDPRPVTRADGTTGAGSTTTAWEIVSQSVKSLAVKGEGDSIIVLSKP